MASRALLAAARTAGKRSATASAAMKRQFTQTALVRGGGATPPLPPFARNPAPTEKVRSLFLI